MRESTSYSGVEPIPGLTRVKSVTTDSVHSRLVSGVFWLTATKASAQLLTWLVTLTVVRLLTPEDYGLMGLAVLVNGFLLLFNELGLGAAIVQRSDLTDGELSDLRIVIFLVNLCLFGVVFAIGPALGRYFDEPSVVPLIRIMGATFIINGIGAPAAYVLMRQMKFREKATAEFAGNLSGSIVTLTGALSGWGVYSLVTGYLVMQAVTHAIYVIRGGIALLPPRSLSRLSGALRFGSQVAAGKVLWWISASADSAIVGKLLGTAQLGYYSLAVQFASIPLEKIVSLVTQVALPSFSALQHDDDTLRTYYLKLVNAVAFLTFPLLLGLLLVADDAIVLLLTDKWSAIVGPLQLLCLVTCLRAIETLNTPILLAKNRADIPLFNSLLQAIALPVAFAVGARWGITGVAVGWLAAWPLLFAIVTGQTLKLLGISLGSYGRSLGHPVAGVCAMFAIVPLVQHLLLDTALTVRVAGSCIAGAVTYVAYYALFDPRTLRDVGRMVTRRPPTSSATRVVHQSI